MIIGGTCKLVSYDISNIQIDKKQSLSWRTVHCVLYEFFLRLFEHAILWYPVHEVLRYSVCVRIILSDSDSDNLKRAGDLLVGKKRPHSIPNGLLTRACEYGYNDTVAWLLVNKTGSTCLYDMCYLKACENNR